MQAAIARPASPSEGGGGVLIGSTHIRVAAYVGGQALVLGGVVAASAGEESTALLQRLPDRQRTAGLITEVNILVKLIQESQPKQIRGVPLTFW